MAERLGEKAKDIADARGLLLGPPPKGKGRGVPQLGDHDGPLILESGWLKSYKLWVGDLPKSIDQVYIGQLRPGFIEVNMTNSTSKSGHAQAIITFENLDLALAAF